MKNSTILSLFIALLFFSNSVLGQSEKDSTSLGLAGDNLDLYAVLGLFQQSKTIEEFEQTLNLEKTGINNLDLNMDKQVDFIKVESKKENDEFTFILQVAVSANETQDVAVILVGKDKDQKVTMQIVGDPDLYGKDYIVELKETKTPSSTPNPAYMGADAVTTTTPATTQPIILESTPIVQYVYSPVYVPYYPPYYYGYYPPYYSPYAPVSFGIYIGFHAHYHYGYGGYGYRGNTVVIHNHNTYNHYNNNVRHTSNTVNRNNVNGNYNGNNSVSRPHIGTPSGGRATNPSTTPNTRPASTPSGGRATNPTNTPAARPANTPSPANKSNSTAAPANRSSNSPSNMNRPANTPAAKPANTARPAPSHQQAQPSRSGAPRGGGGGVQRQGGRR